MTACVWLQLRPTTTEHRLKIFITAFCHYSILSGMLQNLANTLVSRHWHIISERPTRARFPNSRFRITIFCTAETNHIVIIHQTLINIATCFRSFKFRPRTEPDAIDIRGRNPNRCLCIWRASSTPFVFFIDLFSQIPIFGIFMYIRLGKMFSITIRYYIFILL